MNKQKILQTLLYPKKTDTEDASLDMLIALLPAVIAGCVFFGGRAVLLLSVCMLVGVVSEWAFCRLLGVEFSFGDLSGAVSGLLIGMTMSVRMNVFAAALCVIIAVAVTRVIFGGAGCEIVNTAAFGAALVSAAFPVLSGKWSEAFLTSQSADYALRQSEKLSLSRLLLGAHGGGIGEVGAVFLLLGGVYLCVRRVISFVMPLTLAGSVALFSFIFGQNVAVSLLGGGLLLCAIFMLTDGNCAPEGLAAQMLFSVAVGFVCVLLRKFAPPYEGVYFALIAMNLLRPIFCAVPDFKFFGRTEE